MTLAQLTAEAPRLALVGLAKNTGKTVTLNALLAELAAAREPVGVTSVGRDGEQHDVIDFRIEKPLVRLSAGDLVATTDGLLAASGIPHELIERTGVRTPMGEVLLARLKGEGTVEIAGPSAASDTREIARAMLAAGAVRVVIDGAIDRRAASSPEVSDGLVMSTGAILSEDMDEVVTRTAEAVALVRVPGLDDSPEQAAVRRLAAGLQPGEGVLVDEELNPSPLPSGRFVLTSEPPSVESFLRAGDTRPRWLLVRGAVPESFLMGVLSFVRRARRPVTVVAGDPTKVFLSDRGIGYYASAGVELRAVNPIDLLALTVNPVAPQSHTFDSARLREKLAEAIPDVPIFDVLHPSYAAGAPHGAGVR